MSKLPAKSMAPSPGKSKAPARFASQAPPPQDDLPEEFQNLSVSKPKTIIGKSQITADKTIVPPKTIISKSQIAADKTIVPPRTIIGRSQVAADKTIVPAKSIISRSMVAADKTIAPGTRFPEVIPEDDEPVFVIPAKSVLKTEYDFKMASRQSFYNELLPEEKEEQDAWARDQLAKHAACPEQWKWVRRDAVEEGEEGGYQCVKGGHSMTDYLLAEGKGGFFMHKTRVWEVKKGPYYPHPGGEEGDYIRGDNFREYP